ncbi:reverse transcriptase domain-containing protein [Tanacetum coccineum]
MTVGHDVAYAMTWIDLRKKMTDKYCPRNEMKKLETELWNLKVKGTDVIGYNQRFQELALLCVRMFPEEYDKIGSTLAERQADNRENLDNNNLSSTTNSQETKCGPSLRRWDLVKGRSNAGTLANVQQGIKEPTLLIMRTRHYKDDCPGAKEPEPWKPVKVLEHVERKGPCHAENSHLKTSCQETIFYLYQVLRAYS